MVKNVLILTVGGTPDPLIKSINDIKPDLIYFIPSKQTIHEIEGILKETNFEGKYEIEELETGADLKEAYIKSKKIFRNLKEDYNLNADFTGGTKVMVAGFVLAAVGEDCEFTYVDARTLEGRTKNGVGTVKSGYELIKKQIDPFNEYAILEFNMGKKFFNKYQFKAAEENFKIAYKKLKDENLKQLTKIYLKIIKFYDSWDKFNNHFKNKTTLNKYLEFEILNEIEYNPYLNEYFTTEEKEFYTQMQDNLNFLENKISNGKLKIENLHYYLPDLLNNTQRRIEEQKYDDAIARLYRITELIAQINLFELDLIHDDEFQDKQKFLIDNEKVKNTYNRYAIEFLEKINSKFDKNKTSQLGLKNSYKLLKIFNNKIAKEYIDNEDLSDKIAERNVSILAHGITAMDEELANELYEKVYKYSKKTIPKLDELIKKSKYPKFKDLRI